MEIAECKEVSKREKQCYRECGEGMRNTVERNGPEESLKVHANTKRTVTTKVE